MKKKILFIGRFPPPTHGAAVMNELYFQGQEINEKFRLKKINVSYSGQVSNLGKFGAGKFFGTMKSFLCLGGDLIFFNPDLVYFEIAPHGIAFLRDSLMALMCKSRGKKILFQIHARNINKSGYARFIFRNEKMIILSEKLSPELEGLFNEDQVYILPNGIKDYIGERNFQGMIKNRKSNKKPLFLFLSNMYHSKGTLDTLKICNYLKKECEKFRCIFAGDFPDEESKKEWFETRKKLGLENDCEYLGSVSGENKTELLKKANFLIFPTAYENESFPLVILEAFMFGIPVFTYDNGAIKEMVSKDFLGSVVKKSDWKNLAKALERNLGKKQNPKKIREYFLNNYKFEIAERRLIDIFEKEITDDKK